MEDLVQNDVVEAGAEGSEAQQPSIESLQSQLQQQQILMEQQNLAHQNQMKQMMDSLGSLVRAGGAPQQVQPQAPEVKLPPGFENLDLEDPYVAPLANLAQHMAQQNAQLAVEVKNLRGQMSDQLLKSERREITGNVEAAISKHKVPEELKDLARTTVFALMHSSEGKNIDADTMVRNYMQQVGKYTDGAFKRRAEEAKQPRSLASVMRSAGVPKETPKNWDDAKAASLAFIKAMRG